jgi:hypothetical protein
MSDRQAPKKALGDSLFENVREGSLMSYPCSPDLGDGFLGIRINAPKSVPILPHGDRSPISNAFAHIVICGAYALKHKDSQGVTPDHIVLFARNNETGRTYQSEFGRLQHVGVSVTPGSMPDASRTSLEASQPDPDNVVERYFNANIAHFVPEYPGSYSVHAQLGAFKSNEVRIEIMGTTDKVQREGAALPDEAFEQVHELSDKPFPCTPTLEEGFIGIRINAAKVIKLGARSAVPKSASSAKIMVCGAYSLTEMNALTGAPDYLQVTFFNRQLGQGFANNIGSIYLESGMTTPQAPERAKRGYFNINIARMGPTSPGIYTVVVSTRDAVIQSNELAIELVE